MTHKKSLEKLWLKLWLFFFSQKQDALFLWQNFTWGTQMQKYKLRYYKAVTTALIAHIRLLICHYCRANLVKRFFFFFCLNCTDIHVLTLQPHPHEHECASLHSKYCNCPQWNMLEYQVSPICNHVKVGILWKVISNVCSGKTNQQTKQINKTNQPINQTKTNNT